MTGAVLVLSILSAAACFSISVCTGLVVFTRGRDLFHLGLVVSFGAATWWLGMATALNILHERHMAEVQNALVLSRLLAGLCLIVAAWRLLVVTPYLLRMTTRGQLTDEVATKTAALDAVVQRLAHLQGGMVDPRLRQIVEELREVAGKVGAP